MRALSSDVTTWSQIQIYVPADEQSLPQNASSAWQGCSGAARHWLAWCSALPPALAALPENKNTDQGEATTEQHACTQTHTRTHAQWQGKPKEGRCTPSEVKSQMTSRKPVTNGQERPGVRQHNTSTHTQTSATATRNAGRKEDNEREKTEEAMSV